MAKDIVSFSNSTDREWYSALRATGMGAIEAQSIINNVNDKLAFNETFESDDIHTIEQVGYDPVNHPFHYNQYEGLEIIDLTEQLNFNKGNAVKYICRAGYKSGVDDVTDLEKAAWYIQREISRIRQVDTKMTKRDIRGFHE